MAVVSSIDCRNTHNVLPVSVVDTWEMDRAPLYLGKREGQFIRGYLIKKGGWKQERKREEEEKKSFLFARAPLKTFDLFCHRERLDYKRKSVDW